MAVEIPDELIEQICQEKTVLFVGAGLSMRAGLPSWPDLLRQMLDWSEKRGVDLTNRAELESHIEDGKLLLVAEEMRERLGGEKFRTFMRETFQKLDLKPTDTHLLLPEIPFTAVLTSNYDTLLESAYTLAQSGEAPHVFTHVEYPELSAALRSGEFYVLKVHGTIDRIGTVVLGRGDYRKVMYANSAYRRHIETLFSTQTVLFLGFGLTDPDLLLLLEELRVAFKDYTGEHYALMSIEEADPIQCKGWQRDYGIQIIPYQATEGHPEVHEFLSAISDKVAIEKELQEYLKHIKHRCETIGLAKILSEEALSVKLASLEDLFVPPAFRPEEPTLQVSPLPSTEKAERRGERESKVEEEERREPMAGQDVTARIIERDLFLKDLFSKKRHFVVLGEAGSGKTTLLQYTAFSLASGQNSQIGLEGEYIPIWINLREFAEELGKNPELKLLSFVHTDLEGCKELEPPMRLLRDRLDKGQCVVLFDSLDEIANPKQREVAVNAIRRFTWDSGDNLFVMTSREEQYKEVTQLTPAYFLCYNLQPFSSEDIRKFLKKWYRYQGETDETKIDKQVRVIWKAIDEDEDIADLARNPLMLVLIAAITQEGKLPHRRVEIYKKCVELLLGEWRRKALADHKVDRVKFSYLKGRAGFVGYWIHKYKITSAGSEREKSWQELIPDLAEYIREREDDPNPQSAAEN
ncbi:MAG: SIR2 family protein, partial [Promethearchaeota archaeon]